MRELALFAGAGGGILGGHLLGWKTVCAVEKDPHRIRVLLQRQRDGILERFPIWDDITTFDPAEWCGRCDIITGGFPCQDISCAGKGAGLDGKNSGLWQHMSRVVCKIRPKFFFVENSPILTGRGLGQILGNMATMGYDARWCVLGAADTGAPHKRDRIWILAYSNKKRLQENRESGGYEKQISVSGSRGQIAWWENDPSEISDPSKTGFQDRAEETIEQETEKPQRPPSNKKMWAAKPELGRVAYGVANRVDRIKAIGDGQVPAVAAIAFVILSEGLE